MIHVRSCCCGKKEVPTLTWRVRCTPPPPQSTHAESSLDGFSYRLEHSASTRPATSPPLLCPDPAVDRILDSFRGRAAAMLGALIIEPVVEHVIKDERTIRLGLDAHVEPREARLTTGALRQLIEIDQESELPARLLGEVADVEQVVMGLVLLARVIAHHLERLERHLIVPGEGRDPFADPRDRPVLPLEDGGGRGRSAVCGDRAYWRACESSRCELEHLLRLLRRDEILQQAHARGREHLNHPNLLKRMWLDAHYARWELHAWRVAIDGHGAAARAVSVGGERHRRHAQTAQASALPRAESRCARRRQHELVLVMSRPPVEPAACVCPRESARHVDGAGEAYSHLGTVRAEHAVHVYCRARPQALLVDEIERERVE